MFGARFNHETRFFVASGRKGIGLIPDAIHHRELSGIESIALSHQASSSTAYPLGTRKGITTSTGPVQQSLALSRYLIYNDPILGLTGTGQISGSIHYADRSYGFKSGHLTNYSVNCAVGAIPKVSTNFQIFGEMKSGYSTSGTLTHPDIYIPSQGSISLTCDNGYDSDVSSTNRVVGFDYSVASKIKPLFSIGRKNPSEVVFIPPLQYSASVQVDVDEAMLQSGFNFLTGRENRTLTFTINGRDGDSLQSLTVPKASLVGEQLNASADGALKLTLNYIGHS
jgi:hypothetical protein